MCTPISLALAHCTFILLSFFFILSTAVTIAAAAATVGFSLFFLSFRHLVVVSIHYIVKSTHTYTHTYIAENIDRKTHRHEKEKKVNKKKGQKVVDARRRSWTMYVFAHVYARKNKRSAVQIHPYSKFSTFVCISFKVSIASILIIDLQASISDFKR
jgi:hypothetical protein